MVKCSNKMKKKKKTYLEPKQHHSTSFGLVFMFAMWWLKVGGQQRVVVMWQ